MKVTPSLYLSHPDADPPFAQDPVNREQWRSINQLGSMVDKRIADVDLRLTAGGEPTFVAKNDYESAEWRSTADSPDKLKRGEELLWRLKDRFAVNGIVQFGLGKLYPREAAPRWALSLSWRVDSLPLWSDSALLTIDRVESPPTAEDAEVLCRTIATHLHLTHEYCLPAFEELPYLIVRGKKYSLTLSEFDLSYLGFSEASNYLEVKKNIENKPSAYVLPLRIHKSEDSRKTWISEKWNSLHGEIYLVPGDAPAGLRLPLDSLRELAPEHYPAVVPIDPSKAPRDLAPRDEILENYIPENKLDGPVRTALVVEPRDGRLFVFLPPISDAEDFACLIAAIEDAVKSQKLPIRLEGYLPPLDPRLTFLTITPDPGVLEVNIQPANNWNELVGIVTTIYEEAMACGLTAHKYNYDGRLIGTGGGSHVVMGANRPVDSPFLRNPIFLERIITYWQNHPSLSYLFSGLFIGSTSQAPRVDEARHESLDELDIAFGQIPRTGSKSLSFYELGRLFRNLLVDYSGNTHRAEICIDKLWGDAGRMGRLGLVEFRGFEMSPYASMSLLQHLLVRAVIVKLWESPYKENLIRWDSQIHNKFMLPYFIWQDFLAILRDLEQAGFVFDPGWFEPQFNFRFPLIYKDSFGGCEVEVRHALEPWNVLSEDDTNGSTSRPVDYSLERLQIRTTKYDKNCHLVTCNDVPLPFFETEETEVAVAGVRFCARQLNISLHPAIEVHAPLDIEVYDLQSGGRLGGCRYHVKPVGKSEYETLPRSDSEAACRCRERLEILPPLPDKIPPNDSRNMPKNPFTLDLRQVKI